MSIRYSQDFKDSLVKLHQEGRSLKSLAEEFGPSKDSIAIWLKQTTPIMIKGQSKTLKLSSLIKNGLLILPIFRPKLMGGAIWQPSWTCILAKLSLIN